MVTKKFKCSERANKKILKDKNPFNIRKGVEMAKKRSINLKFLKINYLNNLIYYSKGKHPKEVFTSKLKNFFKETFESNFIFKYEEMTYRFGALEIGENFIFGKLWKLKKKQDKDFPWNGKDYDIKSQLEADYQFSYFYINTQKNHLIIEDEREFTSDKVICVLSTWFDSFHNIKDGLNLQYLKSQKDFIKELEDSYKIVYAKFVVYPSNLDFDNISEPLDESMHKFGISEMKQEMKSNDGIKMDLDKPNIFSSSLAQSLRGNGEDPEIRTKDKKGNISIISKKIKNIKRQIQGIKDLNNSKEIKPLLIEQLNEVLEDLDGQE